MLGFVLPRCLPEPTSSVDPLAWALLSTLLVNSSRLLLSRSSSLSKTSSPWSSPSPPPPPPPSSSSSTLESRLGKGGGGGGGRQRRSVRRRKRWPKLEGQKILGSTHCKNSSSFVSSIPSESWSWKLRFAEHRATAESRQVAAFPFRSSFPAPRRHFGFNFLPHFL